MLKMATTLTKFNNTIEQLIDALMERYSYHEYFSKEFSLAKEKFILLRKTNPRKVMEGVLVYVYPYKNQIMNSDESFFLNKNYENDTKDEGHLVKALKIKDLWESDMDDNTKESIFTYFKVIIVLSEKYVAENINH